MPNNFAKITPADGFTMVPNRVLNAILSNQESILKKLDKYDPQEKGVDLKKINLQSVYSFQDIVNMFPKQISRRTLERYREDGRIAVISGTTTRLTGYEAVKALKRKLGLK